MKLIDNIKLIRLEKNIKQEVIADVLGFDIANYSRIENGKQDLRIGQLEKIASLFGMNVIDIYTYPKKYVDRDTIQTPERVSVTFEINPENKDLLLSLINPTKNNYSIAAENKADYKTKK